MCGRYAYVDETKTTETLYQIRIRPQLSARYNIAPTQVVPIIANDRPDELLPARWGFVPSWAKSLTELKISTINARSESVATSRLYAPALKRQRCLVPASGFYEWRTTSDGKAPHYIHLRELPVLAMAGLWSEWTDPTTGEVMRTFTILTCAANELMRSLHERMPVIVSPQDASRWLTTGASELLRPYSSEAMEAWPVSKLVNNARNDSPACLLAA